MPVCPSPACGLEHFAAAQNPDSEADGTVGVAMFAFGLALMVLPTLVVGDELLILAGVAAAVGLWFLADRHGWLWGFVDANQNGVDDHAETVP